MRVAQRRGVRAAMRAAGRGGLAGSAGGGCQVIDHGLKSPGMVSLLWKATVVPLHPAVSGLCGPWGGKQAGRARRAWVAWARVASEFVRFRLSFILRGQ